MRGKQSNGEKQREGPEKDQERGSQRALLHYETYLYHKQRECGIHRTEEGQEEKMRGKQSNREK